MQTGVLLGRLHLKWIHLVDNIKTQILASNSYHNFCLLSEIYASKVGRIFPNRPFGLQKRPICFNFGNKLKHGGRFGFEFSALVEV